MKRARWTAAAAALLFAVAGCGHPEIDTTYGRRRGTEGGASVSGTGVLADMFADAGNRVSTKGLLTPRLHDYDTIVWFPDDFAPPSEEQQEFLDSWRDGGPQRTLVYVGRDYDAAAEYWQRILPQVPPDQAVEVLRRLSRTRADADARRAARQADASCRWFGTLPQTDAGRKRRAESPPVKLTGRWTKHAQLDAGEIAWAARGGIQPVARDSLPPGGRNDVLLAVDGQPAVWRMRSPYATGSQTIVVANGSFLLNLPLVHPEHRKLAGCLIRECGSGRKVVFLESGPGGPPVLDQELGEGYPTGLEALTVWPINAILLHAIALGLLLLFTRLIVFGRPRELPAAAVSDFGRHIDALGRLLAGTQDAAYARHQLAEYRDRARPDPSERKAR